MARKAPVRFSFKSITFGLMVVATLLSLSFLFRIMATYNYDLDRFSFYARNYDKDGTAKELLNLKNDYLKFSQWHLQYLADRYLFKDMFLYEAETAILNEDYDIADSRLKGHENDHRALYMIGIYKFKALHAAYHSDAAKKDQTIKDDILNKVIENVHPDFEAAVKKGPGPAKAFNYSYNYDLSSDKKSAQKALESMPKPPKYVLGIQQPKPGDKSGQPGKKDKQDKRADDPSAGKNDTRKKG